MKKIYIDVDGVLIGKDLKPAKHVEEFLKEATAKHECYWLTTHSRNGDVGPLMEYFSQVLPKNVLEYCSKVKPNPWVFQKTDGIDIDADFLWFDDVPTEVEKDMLDKSGKLQNLVVVDLDRNPDQLLDLIRLL